VTLAEFWFVVITVLWAGFFVLEGFDFGVGILHGPVGHDEPGKEAAVETIGPLWDGNEVWLIVAAAAMFAAFPGWYATTFSALYPAMVLLLVALIVRGVSFEYRSKVTHPRWRTTWDLLLTAGSLVAPLLIGVALGNLLGGLPIGSNEEYEGGIGDLIRPYPLFVGLTLTLLCVLHGATFLALKTVDDMRDRARRIARRIAPLVGLVVLVFASWTHLEAGRGFFPNVIEVAAVLAVFAAAWLARDGQDGWAFTATTVAVVGSVVSIFVDLYPRVMVSSNGSATDLTVSNTASGSYSLKVMTVVLALLLPVVLAYQGWTYYVFRRRVTRAPVAPARGARAAGRGGRPVTTTTEPGA